MADEAGLRAFHIIMDPCLFGLHGRAEVSLKARMYREKVNDVYIDHIAVMGCS